METSTIPPIESQLTVEEQDALASQLMDLIGGITGGACPTPEEPEEKDLWSAEEGDDSVFYSDEEQAHQDRREAPTPGTNMCRGPANSVADEGSAQDEASEKDSGTEKETTQQTMWTEEMSRKFEAPKTEQVISVAADGGAEFEGTSPEHEGAAEKVYQQTEEDVQETRSPDHDTFDASNIQSHERLNGGAETLKPLELSNRQLEKDREGEEHDFDANAEFHQNHGPGYFTLPLVKKTVPDVSHQEAFDHLSSSRYRTTSYRRIRRGNTRQKIDEFEFIMKNQ